jgi:hypothetical protein
MIRPQNCTASFDQRIKHLEIMKANIDVVATNRPVYIQNRPEKK